MAGGGIIKFEDSGQDKGGKLTSEKAQDSKGKDDKKQEKQQENKAQEPKNETKQNGGTSSEVGASSSGSGSGSAAVAAGVGAVSSKKVAKAGAARKEPTAGLTGNESSAESVPRKSDVSSKNKDDIIDFKKKKKKPKPKAKKKPNVQEVPYGEHYTRDSKGRKALKANVSYTTEEGYKYKTDSQGRIVEVEAEKLVFEKGKRNNYMQREAGRDDRRKGNTNKKENDDGGHLIGTQFKGSGDLDNLVAQNSQINRSGGEWYKMEQQWANALKEKKPKDVRVRIKPKYSGSSLRPDSFEVLYKIEGKDEVKRKIKNEIGG